MKGPVEVSFAITPTFFCGANQLNSLLSLAHQSHTHPRILNDRDDLVKKLDIFCSLLSSYQYLKGDFTALKRFEVFRWVPSAVSYDSRDS